ncbi:MAG: mevalonate kinase, partial [Anaerolineae bacterium]|nr:mevalonate kinase [Anaerolineae bacterium]
AAVRQGWQADPARYEAIFDGVEKLVEQARSAIETGNPAELGALMDQNHALLKDMGVSSPELEKLISAAREAGALGAKLSGGGGGGNMIALVAAERQNEVEQALLNAGASNIINTRVEIQT